jgi:hypothetical protein
MGMYTWLNKNDIENYSKVSDKVLNEVFQDVRELMPTIYISERIHERKPFLGKKVVNTTYSIYHLVDKVITEYSEVRCMNLNLSNNDLVFNYLCGLINGYHRNPLNQKAKI